jgi:hypothetical protein
MFEPWMSPIFCVIACSALQELNYSRTGSALNLELLQGLKVLGIKNNKEDYRLFPKITVQNILSQQ